MFMTSWNSSCNEIMKSKTVENSGLPYTGLYRPYKSEHRKCSIATWPIIYKPFFLKNEKAISKFYCDEVHIQMDVVIKGVEPADLEP